MPCATVMAKKSKKPPPPRVGFGSVPLCRCRARGGPRTSHYATANIRTVTTVGSLNNNSNNSRVGQQLSNVRDFCEH